MGKKQLDDTDRQLISALSANARTPAALLARRLGLSRSAVQDRLKRLERDRVILGYTVTLGADLADSSVSAQVMLTLDPKLQDRAVDALRGLPEVKSAHTVSGVYDLVAEVTAATAEALDDVLTRIGKLPGVTRTTSSILLSTKFERR
ncbi:MAG: AsnC family transcriptional regulator [Alphaproteobacteria bacterium]|nr:MAG: AsnC family transcriptional regulator [Alphaproteobacteria bacterium]